MPSRSIPICTLFLILINASHHLLMIFFLLVKYFGIKDEQVPLIIIQNNDGEKFIKPNLEPDQIASWVKDFKVILPSLFVLLSCLLYPGELRPLGIKYELRLYLFSLIHDMRLIYFMICLIDESIDDVHLFSVVG